MEWMDALAQELDLMRADAERRVFLYAADACRSGHQGNDPREPARRPLMGEHYGLASY